MKSMDALYYNSTIVFSEKLQKIMLKLLLNQKLNQIQLKLDKFAFMISKLNDIYHFYFYKTVNSTTFLRIFLTE